MARGWHSGEALLFLSYEICSLSLRLKGYSQHQLISMVWPRKMLRGSCKDRKQPREAQVKRILVGGTPELTGWEAPAVFNPGQFQKNQQRTVKKKEKKKSRFLGPIWNPVQLNLQGGV